MLNPNDRSLYTAALTPPDGFVFDQALGTTFSLDPTTLLTVPLHLALLHRERDAAKDGIALLEALRRVAERTTVYVQRGRVQVPPSMNVLCALLENMLVEARAPQGGAFHPKLWVLRFREVDAEIPLLRLLVLSRNLTADRSWDLSLQLEGRPGGGNVAANRALGELIAALPEMAVGPIDDARHHQAAMLADEVRKTRWELPAQYESVEFHVLGRKKGPWRLPDSHELAVISPFVTDDALQALHETTGSLVAVISRPEELEGLTSKARALATGCYTLQEEAETEDGEATEQRDTLGLHAKAYILRCGWDTKLFVGSANATSAALLAGKNLEVLAELTGKRSKVGGIDDLLGPKGIGPVVSPYEPPKEPSIVDVEEKAAEAALEAARDAVCNAVLRLHCEREHEEYRLVLHGDELLRLEGIAGLRVWPLTVTEDRAADAWGLVTQGRADLGLFATASITGLLAFELSAAMKAKTLRFALNLPVVGLPPDRDTAILRTVVRNRDGFLRYLMLLLGGLAGTMSANMTGQAGSGGVFRWSGGVDGLPLLEELTRAFSRDPEKLREVGQVIAGLTGRADGEDIVPKEFLELWSVFEQALGERFARAEEP